MILRGGKQLEGPKGVSNDGNFNDENDVVETRGFSPSNDTNADVINNANELPKDPKQSSLKPFTQP